MEGIGAEVSQKIRAAIKAKLMEIGVFVDEELPDYVMVMVANKRSKDQMDEELELFLGKHTSLFTTWLHQVLQKLQEVTVANLGNKKKKSSDDSKKKKKSKQVNEKKDLKKKIKVEPEDNSGKKQELSKKVIEGYKTLPTDSNNKTSLHLGEISNRKDRTESESSNHQVECAMKTDVADVVKPLEETKLNTGTHQRKDEVSGDSNERSVQNITEDLDDEDCINIRTDGELLYTAEEMNAEEPSKSQDKRDLKSLKSRDKNTVASKPDKRLKSFSQSPQREKPLLSNSPSQKCKSRSRTPPKRVKTYSNNRSPNQRQKTRSRSPISRQRVSSRSPTRQNRLSTSQSPVRKSIQRSRSPQRQRDRKKSEDRTEVGKAGQKKSSKESSPHRKSTRLDSKVADARELLNRKKAARELGKKVGSRSRSRDRSRSPIRKRFDRGGDRNHRSLREDKDVTKGSGRDNNKNRKIIRVDDRDRKSINQKDESVSKRKEDIPSYRSDPEKLNSRAEKRLDSKDVLKRLDKDVPNKSSYFEKPVRGKKSTWDVEELFKTHRVVDKDDEKEEQKRSGLSSRVVPRPLEPEDNVETPVPSVVKVTPRPRRPASQQPSSTLIMKAISEANRSLACVPQRPDSTQRTRTGSTFSRALQQLKRIPPEKIAISISNPLALQNVQSAMMESSCPPSPRYDESARNRSPREDAEELNIEPANGDCSGNKDEPMEENLNEESQEPKSQELLESKPLPSTETCDEELDTQFVVTLNGYDPDGLFSQSELDMGEEAENDDWLKENVVQDPLQTSTPNPQLSPLSSSREEKFPSVVINSTQPINRSNLIEVKSIKNAERCKYWPACRLGDKCIFYHPSKPCMVFPACKFGDSCLYIHPQCKFNALCTRKDCVFAHTAAYTPTQPSVMPKPKVLYAASPATQCKFYPNCTNMNCQFAHPQKVLCRFGLYCTKRDCSYDHNQVAPVDKLKWTRITST